MNQIAKTLVVILATIVSYFIFQVISAFVGFAVFGSGNIAANNDAWVSLLFVFLQGLIWTWFYYKRLLITKLFDLIFSLILLLALYSYFELYIPSITVY